MYADIDVSKPAFGFRDKEIFGLIFLIKIIIFNKDTKS